MIHVHMYYVCMVLTLSLFLNIYNVACLKKIKTIRALWMNLEGELSMSIAHCTLL